MVDFQNKEIHEKDYVAFIRNTRGKRPRFAYGIIELVCPKSVVVREVKGEIYHLYASRRSHENNKMLNMIVINKRPDTEGNTLDCSGYPVSVGDKVAFMEAPSQDFSTSLIIGEVTGLYENEVIIKKRSTVEQRYMRKPNQVVVIRD